MLEQPPPSQRPAAAASKCPGKGRDGRGDALEKQGVTVIRQDGVTRVRGEGEVVVDVVSVAVAVAVAIAVAVAVAVVVSGVCSAASSIGHRQLFNHFLRSLPQIKPAKW